MIAAGYDNGDIKLLDLRTNKLLWETNVANGVVGLQFDRKDIAKNKLVVTTLESRFRVYDMKTQHPTLGYECLIQKAHKSTVWLGVHTPQNRELFMTCGGNGALNMYKYEYPDQRSIKVCKLFELFASRGHWRLLLPHVAFAFVFCLLVLFVHLNGTFFSYS